LLRQGVPQVSGNEKCTTGSVSLARCRSMPLKAQLNACRREYEADAEPRVIDAARRSIQALAETGLVSRAVTAGDTAPLFRLRCGPGGSFNLADLLTRGPVVTSFLWGDWCPFCVLELQALAAAHPEIERLGATLVALSPQARAKSSPAGSGGEPPFPVMQDPGCGIAGRYRSPMPSQSDSEPPTSRWATPIRRRPDRKVGCCRYPLPTSSIAPALSCFPISMPITPRGWSRPRSLLH
jgi:peroxiredoxin